MTAKANERDRAAVLHFFIDFPLSSFPGKTRFAAGFLPAKALRILHERAAFPDMNVRFPQEFFAFVAQTLYGPATYPALSRSTLAQDRQAGHLIR
jgi:hypothetical protein